MSTTAALVKLPCILAVTVGLHTSWTVPGYASKNEIISISGLRGMALAGGLQMATAIKVVFWAVGGAEAAVIVSMMMSTSPSHVATYATTVLSILTKDSDHAQNIRLTPLSVVGLALVSLGTLLRRRCYQEMGPLFTGAVAIRKNHKLITSGPYGVVRHPSYSGILVVFPGMVCWFCSRGSWLRESGVLEFTAGFVFFYAFGLYLSIGIMAGISRMGREDEELRRVFGQEWDAWARRVPYRIVPGLY